MLMRRQTKTTLDSATTIHPLNALLFSLLSVALCLIPVEGRPEEIPTHTTQKNVMVPMRDGVKLATDIYIPGTLEDRQWPTILTRSPYGKPAQPEDSPMLRDGYVVVVQDVRGRFESEGNFRALADETNDGIDTIAWIREQPWSNGRIGMTSGSYLGATQWLPAVHSPSGLQTISPMITGSLFNGFGFYARGVVQLDVFLLWTAAMADEENRRRGIGFESEHLELKEVRETAASLVPLLIESMQHAPGSPEAQELGMRFAALQQEVEEKNMVFLRLPLHEAVRQLLPYAPWFNEWVENFENPDAPFWRGFDWERTRHSLDIPALHYAAWHDLFVRGQLDDFASLSARPNSPFQKLIVLPDKHANVLNPNTVPMGEVVFPYDWIQDEYTAVKVPEKEEGRLYKRWMDHWLKDLDTGLTNEAPVTLYVQGANVWRDEWEWPLARTEWTPIYLHSGGKANTAAGDGVLVFDVPQEDSPFDRYRYDPANPVPSKGGTFLNLGIPPGMFEQSSIEQRDDVLVYTSEPITEPMEVTGPISMTLWASTSAVDTDFTAKLVDVRPDGAAYNISDGVTRLRFRESSPGLVTPNEIQKIEIELAPTSYVFEAGHRVRLQVSSSNFPLFDPNSNTGKSLLVDANNEMVIANQSVYHDANRPSHIVLPVIPE